MSSECLQLVRRITLAASGETTITFESGSPYHHLTMWVRAGSVSTITVTAQPLYGGVNSGSSTAVSNSNPTKVFQMADQEVRPATNITYTHPSDQSPAESIKPALKLTNGGSDPVNISVYIVALVGPGGM